MYLMPIHLELDLSTFVTEEKTASIGLDIMASRWLYLQYDLKWMISDLIFNIALLFTTFTISLLVHLDQRSMWTIAITWRPSSVVCRLSSVVCKLFTFQASSPKPLGRLEPNLAGMFLGWSSTKLLFFVPVGYSIWLPGPIICSDWLKFQRSSSLKLMNWPNPNCKWLIIGMSFTKLLFFMPIGNPRWPPPQDIN